MIQSVEYFFVSMHLKYTKQLDIIIQHFKHNPFQ